MQSYKTLPRRKRYDIEKLPEGKKEMVEGIMNFLEEHNMTMEEFADLPPKLAPATICNLRNPENNSTATNRTVICITDKIAQEDQRAPEEVFADLTRGFPEGTYQYKKPEKKKPYVSEAMIKLELLTKFLNIQLITDTNQQISVKDMKTDAFSYVESLTTGKLWHDLILDYTGAANVPLNYWVLDIFKDGPHLKSVLKDFFYKIMVDAPNETVKYSIVTDSENFFDEFVSYNSPLFGIYISCILYKDGEFKESYINTAIDHVKLDKIGLTQ